jgi:uncharacterized protein (DUF924 family)
MRDSKTAILDFWFTETKPAQHFQKNPDFDALIAERFSTDYDLAAAGIFDGWTEDGEGCLALILLLDQFPRNMFRDSPQAFAMDAKARGVAQQVLDRHFDVLSPPEKRRFFYLPFEHSEDPADQDKSVALFAAMKKDDPMGYDYALRHRDIIQKFGRFPHRNALLGRVSTAAELGFLKENPGF